jgi:ABC-type sugar transport system substrate-binding protein
MPFRALIAALGGLLVAFAAHSQNIVFINPGKSNENYWVTAARAMEAAAANLGMKLETRYAERDHLKTIELARQIAALPAAQRPDFVLITNDNGTGPELLRVLDGAGVKAFMVFSSIPASDRTGFGGPRERYKGWLGSLEPHAEDAGYLTAKALIAQARKANAKGPDGRIHMIAIAGDRTTPSSIRRNEGMQKAVAEAGDVVVDQVVYAGWSREKAAEQAEWLYERHPAAKLVWAGNDLMAFGAMQAWEKRGGQPGKDAWFSGVNTSREAMEAIRSGRLAALAGGHYITGAWAVVMLHDYAKGRDFTDEGLELDRPMFTLFDARLAERYLGFGEDFTRVDFRRHSKVVNKSLKRYNFEFGQLLR